MKVYFSHGKESGPRGSKIQRLASIASAHGWSDDVIPPEHSIRFAKEAGCTLHLIDGDHRLKGAIEMVEDLFGRFLCRVLLGKK